MVEYGFFFIVFPFNLKLLLNQLAHFLFNLLLLSPPINFPICCCLKVLLFFYILPRKIKMLIDMTMPIFLLLSISTIALLHSMRSIIWITQNQQLSYIPNSQEHYSMRFN